MGIFDDAIREHLELKRQLGADEGELKELEDDAFGPPERPDAENPTGEAKAVASDEALIGDEPEAEEPGAPEPAASESGPALFDGSAGDTPAEAPQREPVSGPEPSTELAESPPTEPATPEAVEPEAPEKPEPVAEEAPSETEHVIEPSSSETGEFLPADEPQTGDLDPATERGDSPSFSTTEREAIADQPTVLFDQTTGDEIDVGELNLELDDELEDVDQALEEPVEAEAPPTDASPVAGEPTEGAELELEEDAPAEEPPSGEEDVLEETPEFLRDNPDDDELWFEQGEPKDFDF